MKLSLTFFAILFSTVLFAQKNIHVRDAKGVSYLSDDITVSKTKELALEEAKKEALRKAGVTEFVSESNVLLSSQEGKQISQLFNSISTIEINGAITKTENIRYEKMKDETTGKEFIEATIDAEVVKYEKRSDPSFDFEVKGISEKYKTTEAMKFSFQPFSDGYLRVFQISKNETSQLFPNKFEQSKLFSKNLLNNFPFNKAIEYSLESKAETEINTIVFIFTKKEIPFTAKQDYESVIKWIYSISPDERRVKSYEIGILK